MSTLSSLWILVQSVDEVTIHCPELSAVAFLVVTTIDGMYPALASHCKCRAIAELLLGLPNSALHSACCLWHLQAFLS